MRIRDLALTLALAGAGIGSAVAGQQAAAPPPPGPGLDLIKERCGFCHSTAQVTSVRKTPAAWAATVQSMIDRGAELEPEEQKVMTDYLAANLAGGDASAPAKN
ncbi:hypothetical protein COC42_03260 [Sphingomonas spermidinifaciens]|uniref:Quinohemoprotein amine dehydrogenase alpha subunit haem binding domain-containing protein n=1 Tax=Sphingomonas spermidinifaciens TaxID=1141889 RepID=A0A2A4B4Q7_9SPHN|nr:hypothetical protein [Sphingomonas spermidinifaciens]PCD03421.1 hypothetical protein COC42_03260 [Sphingomonas spermidinifaciens]